MIFDKFLEFDPSGSLITVTTPSTNAIDLHGAGLTPGATAKPGRDMGAGAEVLPKLMVLVQQTFTAAGAGTLNVQFQGAPDNGSGVPGSYTTYAETGALALAVLIAGNRIFDIDWPRMLPTPNTPSSPPPRFCRLNYVVATGPFTAGTIMACIVLTREDDVYFPAGIAVAN